MTEIAIHTHTQAEWDAVCEVLGIRFENPNTRWAYHGKNSVIFSESHTFASVGWAVKYEYPVVKGSTWLQIKGIEQSKTEDMSKPKPDRTLSWISRRTGITYEWVMAMSFIGLFAGCVALAAVLKHFHLI